MGRPPSVVLGGTAPTPMLDGKDAHILRVALAGDVDLLVTGDMADYVGGSRTARAKEELGSDARGGVDVILLRYPRAPHGLTIASTFWATARLASGVRLPRGTLPRLEPVGRADPSDQPDHVVAGARRPSSPADALRA